jgi:hypothetical protein
MPLILVLLLNWLPSLLLACLPIYFGKQQIYVIYRDNMVIRVREFSPAGGSPTGIVNFDGGDFWIAPTILGYLVCFALDGLKLVLRPLKPMFRIPSAEERWLKKFDSGFCPECGYDIRATPHICPECGTDLQSRATACAERVNLKNSED